MTLDPGLNGAPLRMRSTLRSTSRAVAPPPPPAWQLPDGLDGFAPSGDELLALADRQVPSIIAGVAGECDVLLLAGEEKKGLKTWITLDLAVACVVGGEWLDFQVQDCRPAHVLVLSPETHVSVAARRLRALCIGRGLDAAKILPFVHVSGERATAVPYDEIDATWRTAGLKTTVDALKVVDTDRRRELAKAAHAVADAAQASLGPGVERWHALLDSPPGTWALVVVDTLRAALHGDENSSRDAARYSQAARDLSRRLNCPSVHVHHSSKSNVSGARAARGSTEITAGVDGIISLDTSGEYPTASFTLRNFPAPDPRGYALVDTEGGGVRIETRAPCAAASRKGATIDEGEVLAALERFHSTALTVSSLRKQLAALRGGKPGSKVSHDAVVAALATLERKGLACRTKIERKHGDPLDGWQLGSVPTPAEAEHLDLDTEDA